MKWGNGATKPPRVLKWGSKPVALLNKAFRQTSCPNRYQCHCPIKNQKGQQLCMSTLIRGHFLPLRLTIPPLRTPQGFACSVASLSRCPYHYPPGHHSLRHAALVECPLGQGKPSTWPEGHEESTYTSPTSFHLDDRKAQPFPAVRSMKMKC